MRPEGVLRPIIKDLANRSGAYIIVSAEATSETSLQNRRAAMREAVDDLPNAKDLALDFYDRGRIATWVRNHAGMILWVRNKIGRSLPGWRPYEAWGNAPDGIAGEYLLDETVRVRTDTDAAEPGLRNDTETKEPGLSAAAGIQRIRDLLRRPGSVVRLVGLSGVGKTRFVQALFDSRVGGSILDPSAALYTDVADGPDPSPTILVQNPIATRSRAIVVVDNCPADLHRRVSDKCRVPESTVGVITIEYDIRDDQPEGTEVFALEASSTDLTEKLVQQRFPHLSQIDAHTIAGSSGGNARIAIALAETVKREDSVAGMSDEDLFRRLFEQRHAPNDSLLGAAQGLALVYSFEGENVSDGQDAELPRLGTAVGRSAQEMFQATVELCRRGLVQSRGSWRAVLPQAIANRLAARALQDIPSANVEVLVDNAPERLLKSFSRRLGLLNSSPEARRIAQRWLAPGGLLADVLNFNELGEVMFANIAPIDPEATLSALERAVLAAGDEPAKKCARHVSLLISLAYEPKHFERSLTLLAKIATTAAGGSRESVGKNSNDASKAHSSLFPIHFSCSHASPEQRESVIRRLLDSAHPVERELGLRALGSALEALHFGPVFNFGFGLRSRDFGYWPASRNAVVEWFSRFLKLATDYACSNYTDAQRVRRAIAYKFRGLWTKAAMYDDLERVCRSISSKGLWTEGWAAVRETIYYDSKGLALEVTERLRRIEKLIEPQGTIQRVRSIILADSSSYIGIPLVGDSDEEIGTTMSRLETISYDLGAGVAMDKDVFNELLPGLARSRSERTWSFGRGLAQAADDPAALWKQMVDQLRPTPAEGMTPWVLRGFLNGIYQKNAELAGTLLDEAVDDQALAQWYPALETATGAINTQGLRRLQCSLDLGRAPIHNYRFLEGGRVTDSIAASDFNQLLLKLAQHPEGLDVAIEILYMRLSSDLGLSSTDELVEIGCELMRRLSVTRATDPNGAYRLQIVGRRCLLGERGAATVREICTNLRAAISRSETSAWGHRDLVRILFDAQPLATLQSLCAGDDPAMVEIGVRVLEDAYLLQPHTFSVIPQKDFLDWCEELPAIRYPVVAAGVVAIRHDENGSQWTDIAHRILDKSPDRVPVLRKFMRQFSLSGSDDSRAAEIEANLRLLDDFAAHADPALAEFAKTEKIRLTGAIATMRTAPPLVFDHRDEGFE